MPSVSLVVNSLTRPSKLTSSSGPSKLSQVLKASPWSLLSSREKSRSSKLKKSHQWFSLRWRISLKLTSENKSRTLLLPFPLISTIHKDKQPRMLVPSQVSTFNVSSTNPPLPLLHTVSTRRVRVNATFSSSISVVVLSMFPYSQLKTVSLKSKPPTVTLTWVVKISITELSISALLTSRRNQALTSLVMPVLSVVLEPNAKRQSVFSHQPIKLKLSAKPSLMVKITLPQSPVLNSRNFALTFSDNACPQSNKSSRIQTWASPKFTKSSSLVVQPESPRFKPSSLTSSTERPSTDQSTPMRLLLTVLPSKLLFSTVKVQRPSRISSFSMLFPFPKVSRPLVVSWLFWSQETLPSQPRRPKLSLPMLTTNPVSSFKSSKVSVVCPRTATCSASSTLKVSPSTPWHPSNRSYIRSWCQWYLERPRHGQGLRKSWEDHYYKR